MRKLYLLAAVAALIAAPAFAADDDTLTIGMTLSQTGPLNIDSLAQQRGAELWRDEVNDGRRDQGRRQALQSALRYL